MKLISWNVCGIQSRYDDGTLNEIFNLNPDIFCLQEVHQKPRNLNPEVYCKQGYTGFFYPSLKYKNACGVATYSKYDPINLKNGFDNLKFDVDGRIQRIEFEEFNLYNVYFPTGKDNNKDLETIYKNEFYEIFTKYVMKSKKPQVICGDFNRIASDKDVYEPENHKYTNGCKSIEKQWFNDFLSSGFIDTFRLFNKDTGNYTWWARQGDFRKENKGFRLDYFLVNEELKDNITNASILHQIPTEDHAPISLDIVF